MAKSSYFSNSAKLLSIVSALLFAANAMVAVGSFFANESLFRLGSSLSSFDVYVVLVLGYIAFNGEGLGHKRYGNRKNKKATAFFKLHIIFCFIMNFLKSGIEMTILSVEGTGDGNFEPNRNVSGKEFVKMVLSMAGVKDVTIETALELGKAAEIVTDDIAEKISNDVDLTREDVTVLIYNAMQK